MWLPIAAGFLGLPIVVAVVGAIPIPIALWRIIRIAEHRERAAFERFTFFAVFLLVTTAACELIAFAALA